MSSDEHAVAAVGWRDGDASRAEAPLQPGSRCPGASRSRPAAIILVVAKSKPTPECRSETVQRTRFGLRVAHPDQGAQFSRHPGPRLPLGSWRPPDPSAREQSADSGAIIRNSGTTRRCPGSRARRTRTAYSAPQKLQRRPLRRVDPIRFLCRGGLSHQINTVPSLVGRRVSVE